MRTATGFPDSWAPWLARLIQGSKLPMSELVREVSEALRESPPAARPIPSVEVVTDKVKLLAERKACGVAPKGVVALEDTTGAALWHWEVLSAELLPEDHRGKIKSARADRTKTGKHVKSLIKLREVLTKDPTNAVKISQEEEKVLKAPSAKSRPRGRSASCKSARPRNAAPRPTSVKSATSRRPGPDEEAATARGERARRDDAPGKGEDAAQQVCVVLQVVSDQSVRCRRRRIGGRGCVASVDDRRRACGSDEPSRFLLVCQIRPARV